MYKLKHLYIVLLLLLTQATANAQNLLDSNFILNKKYTQAYELLDSIASKTNINISYTTEIFTESKSIKVKRGAYSVGHCLDLLCSQTNTIHSVLRNTIILKRSPEANSKGPNNLYGRVVEDSTGEAVAYAYLYLSHGKEYYRTNRYGYFSIPKPPRKSFSLWCLAPSKSSKTVNINYNNDSFVIIRLPKLKNIKKVYLKTNFKGDSTEINNTVSNIVMSSNDLKTIPPLLGEYDALNALTFHSGVTKGTEGNNGLFIRGGSPDQNLITMDGATLYNPNHFFGLFSPFNADAIQNVSLQKGGFGAETGGRLSSHLAIDLKDGGTHKHQAHFSLSPIAISASANGPIASPKTSYLISLRRSYFDLIITPLLSENNSVGFYFYDINTKVTHRLNNKNTLSFSFFNFNDKAFNKTLFRTPEQDRITQTEESEQSLNWGNTMAQVRFKGQITNRKFLESNVFYTLFGYTNGVEYQLKEDSAGIETSNRRSEFNFTSKIATLASTHHLTYWLNRRVKLKAGLGYYYHSFEPSNSTLINSSSNLTTNTLGNFNNDPIFANETFGYTSVDFKVSKRFRVQTGLRLSSYHTTRVNYFNPQPRLNAKYKLKKQWELNASVARVAQYLHFATNNTIGIPLDLWLPTTDDLAPSTSNQYALSISKRTKNREFSAEGFYKSLTNIIDYVEGEEYLGLSNSWEEKFVQGHGESYGVDISIRKDWNKLNTRIGYTWSINNRQFDSINNGETYPFKYDRRHNLSAVLSYDISKKWDLFATFQYGSGSAVTLPIARYPSTGNIVGSDILIYGERNANRLRDYHRLDLGLKNTKQHKKYTRIWNFSVYNALNRQNPFYITQGFDVDGNRNFVQISLLPFIPSATFRIEFN